MTTDEEEPPSAATRILIAMILGVLGLVTGVIAVSVFSDLPGVPIPRGASLGVGLAAGAVCAVAGYRFSDRTLDALGNVWAVLWKLSLGILDVVRSLVR
jgi:hypothetical protein